MANRHGGHRRGSGRPKGSHTGARLESHLSPEQQARACEVARLANGDGATFNGDAYALLAWIYRSEDLPITLRMRAAETAIAYERPRLAQVEVMGDDHRPLQLVREIMQVLQGTGRGLPSRDPTGKSGTAPTAQGGGSECVPPTRPRTGIPQLDGS